MSRHAQLGCLVEQLPLRGRSILIVEDEPLIALDITDSFRSAGASVDSARNVQDGLRLAVHPDLSAAVVDFGLGDGDGAGALRIVERAWRPLRPSHGYAHPSEACHSGVLVPKPAAPMELVTTVTRLLQSEHFGP